MILGVVVVTVVSGTGSRNGSVCVLDLGRKLEGPVRLEGDCVLIRRFGGKLASESGVTNLLESAAQTLLDRLRK
jgi:hypothetical protein